MAMPFATVEELVDRLDWDLDAKEMRMAAAALEDASDLARGIGKESWVDSTIAPRLVRVTVLNACKRYMQNPAGYTQSRAGDETLGWADLGDKAGSVFFTDDEERLIRGLAGQASGLYVANTYAWSARPDKVDVFVPVSLTRDGMFGPFPMFAAGDPAAPLDGGIKGEVTYIVAPGEIAGTPYVDGEPYNGILATP